MSEWTLGAPGSALALSHGCTCAVLDNAHGAGRGGDGGLFGWWITEGCPVHTPDAQEMVDRRGNQQPFRSKWTDEADPNEGEFHVG